ncbi:MAG: hypothetical protein MSG64_16665 [Pyrinomonadaceae bacterium MAG19_C2-C3]|nr:hypothetical protein [Pyrinomonadaceae bacterium MAG19_C2-C3]
MGFKKSESDAQIAIVVTHVWHPGDSFTFYFPKSLPQSVLDDESNFYDLTADERRNAYAEQAVNMAARTLSKVEGFDDFPTEGGSDLETRVKTYFNDASHPELLEIIGRAWAAYRESAVSQAYLKSVPRDDAASRGVSPSTAKVEPVI